MALGTEVGLIGSACVYDFPLALGRRLTMCPTISMRFPTVQGKKNCGDDSIEVVAPNGIEFEYINRVRENRKKLTRKYFNEIYN